MRTLTADEKAIIFLDSIDRLEYKHKKALFDLCDKPSDIFSNNRLIEGYFAQFGKSDVAKLLLMGIKDKSLIEESVQKAIRGASDIVTYLDQRYPEELYNTPTPPLCLYAVGNTELLTKNKIGIVGSRKTLNQYAKLTEEISRTLTESGVVVVTGAAEGGDYACLKGGVESGNVISVFAGDVVNVYPSKCRDLVNRILENGGLVISEHPHGIVPRNYFYPVRNRIIAGLSKGVLIVSGDENSGCRYTAEYAVDYGREVFCLPYGIEVSSGNLCKKLIKSGAVLVENAREIAGCLAIPLNDGKEEIIQLTDNEKVLYKLIKDGISSTDELVERSGLQIFETISTLGMLELKGLIVKDFSGNVSAIK